MQTDRKPSPLASHELQTAFPMELLDKNVGGIVTARMLLLNRTILTRYSFFKLRSKQMFQEID